MQPTARNYFVNFSLAFVPDLVVGWVVARLTESGWSGFFYTLLALQGIYFFLWLKTAGWSWLLFWLRGKRQMAEHFENFLMDNRFPAPDENTSSDLEEYFSDILDNETIDVKTRTKAAFELGTLNGFRACGKFSLTLQLQSAFKAALKRYGRLANVARVVAGQQA